VTTYPLIGATGDATILPAGADELLSGVEENIWCTSADGLSQYAVAGSHKPWPGIQDGIILSGGIKGLTPNFKHLDLKAARQPGVTWTGTVYDVLEIEMVLDVHANTPTGMSQAVSEWVSMWKPDMLNKIEYLLQDRGYWWIPARRSKPWPDVLKQMPRELLIRQFTQTVRCDSGFWFGMPSIDTFAPGASGAGAGWLSFLNIGEVSAWPTLLFTGPGTLSFSNGPAQNTTTQLTFGPLEAGQKVLIDTNRRKRAVVDMTSNPGAPNTPTQALLAQIINFVTNNNVPPVLQWFESMFGTFPPQGNLYELLSGQYTNPIPGVRQPSWATLSHLAVSITGGNADSQVVGRIDPQRLWPE
jgi:hypothetical protein